MCEPSLENEITRVRFSRGRVLGIRAIFREMSFARLFRLTQADVTFDTSKISHSKEARLFEGAVKHETKVRLKHACP